MNRLTTPFIYKTYSQSLRKNCILSNTQTIHNNVCTNIIIYKYIEKNLSFFLFQKNFPFSINQKWVNKINNTQTHTRHPKYKNILYL